MNYKVQLEPQYMSRPAPLRFPVIRQMRNEDIKFLPETVSAHSREMIIKLSLSTNSN